MSAPGTISKKDIIGTGMKLYQEVSFIWEIDNLPIILKQAASIKSQKIDFNCGDAKFGEQSQWTVNLEVDQRQRRGHGKLSDHLSFPYTLNKKPATLRDDCCSQLTFVIKPSPPFASDWRSTWAGESTNANLCTVNGNYLGKGWSTGGFSVDAILGTKCDRWDIHFTLKLYSPKERTVRKEQIVNVQDSLEQLHAKSAPKARKALLAGMLQEGLASREVKIISSDGAEFSVPKGVLTARSPVFDSMFRTDMTEANEGIIKLPDIGGRALKVLLGFIYSGELLPEWKESGVIVELTNAAAKYQLAELLKFLDLVLGQVCDLQNVAPLLSLAHKLGLKTAEKELLKFIREKGATSAENFFQIMKVTSGMDSIHI